MILVDTSVWIDFLRDVESPQAQALGELIEDKSGLSLTDLILTETLQGVRADSDFRALKGYLLDFPIYSPSGVGTYVEAAQIHRACRRRGRTPRSTVDCIIAAICIENGLTLLHRDKDFDLIESCTALRCHQL
jgi:predicted nucleic acid-binding protein